MKKFLPLLILLLFCSVDALAKGPQSVSAGRHNFSSVAPTLNPANNYTASNEDEVCIFCHTPHGGALNTPLWNRSIPGAGTFTHYTSATLSLTSDLGLSSTRNVSQESLLCLACHDGTVAINSLLNYSPVGTPDGGTVGPVIGGFWGFGQGALIGSAWDGAGYSGTTLLTDDHPISFSYYDMYQVTSNQAKFQDYSVAEGAGVRFFPPGVAAGAGTKRVECSTCHDPHVNYEGVGGDSSYAPFLITSNTGSQLCLACHIK